MKREAVVVAMLFVGLASAKEPYASRTLDVEGWTLHVRNTLEQAQPESTATAISLLTEQLKLVKAAVPASVIPSLQEVPLYFSEKVPDEPYRAAYHPSRKWLAEHDRDPAMAKAVEFTNIPIFAKEVKRMPVLALHELAHAYHHQVIGYSNKDINAAYDAAVAAKSYESVALRATGKKRTAYAITNPREYFAETSEAYFGTNDFYPFERSDLRKHDPGMYDILERLWKVEP